MHIEPFDQGRSAVGRQGMDAERSGSDRRKVIVGDHHIPDGRGNRITADIFNADAGAESSDRVALNVTLEISETATRPLGPINNSMATIPGIIESLRN